VVDADELLQTLKTRVLQERGLGEVVDLSRMPSALGSPTSGAPPSPATSSARFTHRFAAPFDSVQGSLKLSPLEEPAEGALLHWLAALLALCVVAGLMALYRMTATQVEFAERRSNFVSAVSHELKTPLTAVRMDREMLQDGLFDDEAKRQEYYRTITSESERLSRLINSVLELSRIERRDQAQALRRGDIRGVVREVVKVLRPHAQQEGFSLELDLAERLPQARYEPDTLRQILFNLIDDSLKYCRDATDQRITIARRVAPRGVTLSVRDRGPGWRPLGSAASSSRASAESVSSPASTPGLASGWRWSKGWRNEWGEACRPVTLNPACWCKWAWSPNQPD
jgi:signal transduction histidine kinase